MKVCQSCGHKNVDTHNFCENCAAPLGTTAPSPSLQVQAPQTQEDSLARLKKKRKKKGQFIAILIVVAFMILVGIIGANASPTTETDAASKSAVKTKTSVQTKADKKAEVRKQDKIVWSYFNNIVDAHNKLMDAMTSYSDGKMTKLDLYNYAKEIETYQRNRSMSPPKNTPAIAKEYTRSVADMALFSQTVAQKLKKYLDSGKTSDLSAAQGAIQQVTGSISVIANNRVKVLKDAGFTQAEIEKIAAAS
ncbi:zinc ribbon domain-containing protein [Paenibacillus glycanilyticus]|uniref:zinc-ribbon domain-containing protein n=1 Tax=Paenibacillus glycanilyticus TaxID=126569 RepID=UPI00203EF44E|nr:zinc ribbon domain-containing protein [Paenibacillus glycanilyticus]MCM3631256.1 zinc ribbon domain-containing protein [Paenibacillus glycanilyticus]